MTFNKEPVIRHDIRSGKMIFALHYGEEKKELCPRKILLFLSDDVVPTRKQYETEFSRCLAGFADLNVHSLKYHFHVYNTDEIPPKHVGLVCTLWWPSSKGSPIK